jgi:phosphoribosyl 1,2-cyclic phosphate phosphodiesterase
MSPAIQVSVLGSGTSMGVPVIGCTCSVCTETLERNQRTRSSILVETCGKRILIDTSPDLRAQALKIKLHHIDAVLYTHPHADHCHGFDDLRAYYFRTKKSIPCWLADIHRAEFCSRFAYAFKPLDYLGSRPEVTVHTIPLEGKFVVEGIELEALLLPHGDMSSVAFRMGSFAYATDFKYFPDPAIKAWQGKVHTMLASGLHFRLGVVQGYITHLSHEVDYPRDQACMPAHRALVYDGFSFQA